MRPDGRRNDQIRPMSFQVGFVENAAGSCLVSCGRTKVICTASVEESVPQWMRGRGTGWVTAEYAMLPASTGRRKARDGRKNGTDGRTVEIQRLVGRALRPAVDMALLGERTLHLDCDVVVADGGTRTTAINGAFLALRMACDGLMAGGAMTRDPIRHEVAAVSVAVVDGKLLLDPCYEEDARAAADINFVMTRDGDLIEVQGTGEARPFTRAELDEALELARKGVLEICRARERSRS